MRAPAQIWKKYKSTCLYVNYLKERWQVGGRGEAGITWRVLNKEHVKTGIDIHVNILEQKLRWDHRVRRVSHEKGLWGTGRAESLAWNNHLSVTATQTTLTETQPPSLHALVQVENRQVLKHISAWRLTPFCHLGCVISCSPATSTKLVAQEAAGSHSQPCPPLHCTASCMQALQTRHIWLLCVTQERHLGVSVHTLLLLAPPAQNGRERTPGTFLPQLFHATATVPSKDGRNTSSTRDGPRLEATKSSQLPKSAEHVGKQLQKSAATTFNVHYRTDRPPSRGNPLLMLWM